MKSAFRVLGGAAMAALVAGCAQEPPVETAAPAPKPAETPLTCGEASYYADSLAGNKTASGAPYDPKKATAAHKTLPFGTTLKVVRGDLETVVQVNDRGPYAHGRIIDLSRAAAEDLDLIKAGHDKVCLFVIEKTS